MNLAVALAAVLITASTPAPQPDKPGSRDYPLLQRFPNSYISDFQERDWDRFTFDVAHGPKVPVEGHLLRISYKLQKGTEVPSALEYTRNYENALTSAGWKIEARRDYFLSAHLDKNGQQVWVQINYDGGWGHSDFVVVEKQPLPMIIAPEKATPPPAGAKPDAAGKDYPGIPRLPGQRLDRFEERKFDSANFEMGSGPRHRVEGHKMTWRYQMVKGQKVPSALQMSENYRAVLTAEGWTILQIRPGFLSAMLRNGDKETWAELGYDGGWGSMDLTVVEPGEFKQVVSASNLLEMLRREGHVAFQVHFDTGKDTVKAESKPTIAQMVEVLKADPAMKVEVQGHTDSEGNEKENLALSERRAKAVMAELVASGIDAARLTARGYGQSRPVADNGTEGGRALNRRVELSKR